MSAVGNGAREVHHAQGHHRVIAAGLLCAGVLAGVVACSTSTPASMASFGFPELGTAPDGARISLSEAFCSDLQRGLTPMNILGTSVKDDTYTPREAADLAHGFASMSCPEQLRSNAGLRTYLANWDIDADA